MMIRNPSCSCPPSISDLIFAHRAVEDVGTGNPRDWGDLPGYHSSVPLVFRFPAPGLDLRSCAGLSPVPVCHHLDENYPIISDASTIVSHDHTVSTPFLNCVSFSSILGFWEVATQPSGAEELDLGKVAFFAQLRWDCSMVSRF
jgi:hypothetical protein